MEENDGVKKTVNQLKSMRRTRLITAAVYTALGAVLLLWPEGSLDLICRLFAIGLLASGVLGIILYLAKRDETNAVFLAGGICLTILGVFIFFSHDWLIAIIPAVLGIVVLIDGIANLYETITIRKNGIPGSGASLAISIVTIALGVILLFNPMKTAAFFTRIVGLIVLFNGATDIWMALKINPKVVVDNVDYTVTVEDKPAPDGTAATDSASDPVGSGAQNDS